MNIKFEAGINIAIKIPKSKYDETVKFYKDILNMEGTEVPIENPTAPVLAAPGKYWMKNNIVRYPNYWKEQMPV